jgi:hypothetical protein
VFIDVSNEKKNIFQTTFVDERDHKTGFQVFGELGLHKPFFDLDAVYIDATRIGPSTSNMLMVGFNIEADLEKLVETFRKHGETEESLNPKIPTGGIIVNNSVFTSIDSRLVSISN